MAGKAALEQNVATTRAKRKTKVTKAIFPVAGLGTRFLPATKSIPKEIMTLVDRPLIQYAIDEARAAGIKEFIFVTSREDEFDRVLGLEIGADDYLCKPFSMRELMARVKALLRRAGLAHAPGGAPPRDSHVQVGDLALDPDRYAVSWKGHPVRLTVTEFLLLQALVRHPGHVRSRDQLLEAAYPHDTSALDRTIDSHIKRVRRKFQEADPAFAAIDAVYGAGYRWTVAQA